jgi:hypothetical protein
MAKIKVKTIYKKIYKNNVPPPGTSPSKLQTTGYELAWGELPQGNVYLALSPFSITLHKKER